MIIKEIKYTPFTRKFKFPFQTSKNKFTEKTGFVISIITDEGKEYKGEVSLLFGFGNQTFEDVKKSLINLTAFKNKVEITDNLIQIEHVLEKLNVSPGVRFGFEQALFSYLACETDLSKILKKYFNRKPSNKINVNGLIGFDSIERSVETAQKLAESGFKTIKIKVGRKNFEDDLKNIKTISENISTNVKLRLDVNGKWKSDDAESNLKKLSEFNIEYVEQPCKNYNNLIILNENQKINIAADESIEDFDTGMKIINDHKLNYIVLKPSLLGGIFKTLHLIESAEEKNIYPIISSSFESNLGYQFLILISALVNHKSAHGLNTADIFEDDPVKNIFPVKNGSIDFDYNRVKTGN